MAAAAATKVNLAKFLLTLKGSMLCGPVRASRARRAQAVEYITRGEARVAPTIDCDVARC
jgi:hypothetical protein